MPELITVAALTSGRDLPGTRFRVRQHIAPLSTHSIRVTEFCPAISKYALLPYPLCSKYVPPLFFGTIAVKMLTRIPGLVGSRQRDVTWLERQLVPGFLTLEPFLKRPYVFDVDDSIWMARAFGHSSVAWTARNSATVVAGNNFLADWLSRYSGVVEIVPTAVDCQHYRQCMTGRDAPQDRFTIGWVGTQGNLRYLNLIAGPLKRFLDARKNTKLLIVTDARSLPRQLSFDRVELRRWSPEEELRAFRQMNVGVMPLSDDEWTRGKCSYKMLQYMAAGLPVIVSPVGMNRDVLNHGQLGIPASTEDDWYDAFSTLYGDRAAGERMGAVGRSVAERHFDLPVISERLASIFRKVA